MKDKRYSEDDVQTIAMAFLVYYNQTVPLSFFSTGENNGKSIEEVYEAFELKFKRKNGKE